MSLKTFKDNGKTLLKIEGAIDIHETRTLKDTLIDSLASGDILLDLEYVSECDLAGVQLLYSAFRSAGIRGRTIEITGISEPVIQACESAAVKTGFIEAAIKKQNDRY